MTAVAAARATPRCLSPFDCTLKNITVASATTIYHGSLVSLNDSRQAVVPGAGFKPIGRACCPNGVSATAGQRIDIQGGCFAWTADAGETINNSHIGHVAYAKDNQTVSLNSIEGEALGIIDHVDTDGVWVISGNGVGHLAGGT